MSATGARGGVSHVLLPGLDGTGRLFDPFLRAAPPDSGFRVVRYPAHEILDRDRLADHVAAAVPTGPYVLIAESYSGLVALRFTRRAPAGLVGLVLCNAFTTPPVWPGWRFAPLNALLHVQPPGFVIRWLLLDDHAPPRLVDEVRAAVASVAPRVLAARVREILTTDATDELAACPCPVLYLRGVRDRLVPAAAVAQMTRARPDLACQELDGPHLLLQSRPAVAADAVGAFVRGLAAARGHEPS